MDPERQHYQGEESHIWFTTHRPTRKRLDTCKTPEQRERGVGGGCNPKNMIVSLFYYFRYLLANFWWDILVGKPDLDIRTTSRTPQHLSCCSTSPCSYDSGDWRLLGLMQRIKCGVVLSKRCISWNNWPWMPTKEKFNNLSSFHMMHDLIHWNFHSTATLFTFSFLQNCNFCIGIPYSYF